VYLFSWDNVSDNAPDTVELLSRLEKDVTASTTLNAMKYSPIKMTLVSLALLLAGCSTPSGYNSTPYVKASSNADQSADSQAVPLTAAAKKDLAYRAGVAQTLYQQYHDWKHVPYRWGGMNRKGVDCSAFVYLTYANKFNVELPRTTQYQAAVGSPLAKHQLRAGDLVFFKTGRKNRHVGMYVESGKFLHVSEQKGVVISDLDNVYWSKHYWMARRVE